MTKRTSFQAMTTTAISFQYRCFLKKSRTPYFRKLPLQEINSPISILKLKNTQRFKRQGLRLNIFCNCGLCKYLCWIDVYNYQVKLCLVFWLFFYEKPWKLRSFLKPCETNVPKINDP